MTSENQSKSKPENPTEDKLHSEWANRIRNSKFFNDNSSDNESKWGYDLYPERKKLFEASMKNIVLGKEGRESYEKTRCEQNVFECVKKSSLVRTMMMALESAGW